MTQVRITSHDLVVRVQLANTIHSQLEFYSKRISNQKFQKKVARSCLQTASDCKWHSSGLSLHPPVTRAIVEWLIEFELQISIWLSIGLKLKIVNKMIHMTHVVAVFEAVPTGWTQGSHHTVSGTWIEPQLLSCNLEKVFENWFVMRMTHTVLKFQESNLINLSSTFEPVLRLIVEIKAEVQVSF